MYFLIFFKLINRNLKKYKFHSKTNSSSLVYPIQSLSGFPTLELYDPDEFHQSNAKAISGIGTVATRSATSGDRASSHSPGRATCHLPNRADATKEESEETKCKQ